MLILPTEDDIQKTIQTAKRNRVSDPFTKSGYMPDDISKEREVEDMIEIAPQRELEPLQISCRRIIPVETEPPRRSEQIYAKTHPPSIPGPVTRSMAKKEYVKMSHHLYILRKTILKILLKNVHPKTICHHISIILPLVIKPRMHIIALKHPKICIYLNQ